ncbi:FkbM family methyltransferase, partial [bacterium]
MISNAITVLNDFLKKIDLFSDQSLKGKLYRLYRRLFYILEHPSKIKFLVCLTPSKLILPLFKTKIVNLKYKLDALWLLQILNQEENTLVNFFYLYLPQICLKYKIYYSLSEAEYQNFVASLEEISAVIFKDQYCAQEFLKPESVILDCGANIGLFSLWAYHSSPSSLIYSFEPTKSTFEILEKNIKENKLDKNIYPFNVALGDIIQETEIQISADGLGGANSIIDSQMKNY